jgi:hypothetical protein
MLFWHRQSRNLGAKLDAICSKSRTTTTGARR